MRSNLADVMFHVLHLARSTRCRSWLRIGSLSDDDDDPEDDA